MNDNKESLFRKKALESSESPEQIEDYIHVTGRGVWISLIGVLVILIGVFFWSVYGRLNTVIGGVAVVSDHQITGYIQADEAGKVEPGMEMTIQGEEIEVEKIEAKAQQVPAELDEYSLSLGGLTADMWVCSVVGHADLPDGVYALGITVESIAPISFIVH